MREFDVGVLGREDEQRGRWAVHGAPIPAGMVVNADGFTWPVELSPDGLVVTLGGFVGVVLAAFAWLLAMLLLSTPFVEGTLMAGLVALFAGGTVGRFLAQTFEDWRGHGVLTLKRQTVTYTSRLGSKVTAPLADVEVSVTAGSLRVGASKLSLHMFGGDELAWLKGELARIEQDGGAEYQVPVALQQLTDSTR